MFDILLRALDKYRQQLVALHHETKRLEAYIEYVEERFEDRSSYEHSDDSDNQE